MPFTSRADAFPGADDEQVGEDDSPALPDYYARFGLTPDASSTDLRRAYLRLVKLWHPDRYAGAPDALRERAERRMRLLNEAYDTLGDSQSRATYDRQRLGHGQPVGDVINVFGQRGAAPVWSEDAVAEGHASANPNGAGQFFGMLAAILALALIGGAVGGAGYGGAAAAIVVLVGIVGLLAAAAFFVTDSPLAKWAFQAMESGSNGKPERARRPAPGERATAERTPPRTPDDGNPAANGSIDPATFDALIAEALAGVPHTFDTYLHNVIVRAEQEPDEETLRRVGVPAGHTLLGLYQGVSLTRRGAGDVAPEVITIYRGPIERHCGGDLNRVRVQVRSTVLHELAHHFGIDHDEMPEWVK